MILLLDNYDSFTFNLAQYLGELGAEVDVRRNDQITLDQIAALQPSRIVMVRIAMQKSRLPAKSM